MPGFVVFAQVARNGRPNSIQNFVMANAKVNKHKVFAIAVIKHLYLMTCVS